MSTNRGPSGQPILNLPPVNPFDNPLPGSSYLIEFGDDWEALPGCPVSANLSWAKQVQVLEEVGWKVEMMNLKFSLTYCPETPKTEE